MRGAFFVLPPSQGPSVLMVDSFNDNLISLLPNLRRFALSLCKSSDTADDLVQLTCEKAIANKSSFDPETRLDAWLFRILRNSWIDQIRHRKVQGTSVDLEDAFDLAGEDGSQTTESRMMLKSTAAIINKLPKGQREVILLVCVDEFSYKEVSQILGVPIGTIMSRLARARSKIAAQLGINPETERSSSSTEKDI